MSFTTNVVKKSRTLLERRIELLEQRIAPATFLVPHINDAGPDSLRQAILNADSGAFPGLDTIGANENTSEFSGPRAPVTNTVFTWDGGDPTDPTDWFRPLNWDLDNGVPGAGETAILNIDATIKLPSSTSVGTFQQSDGTFISPTDVTFTVLNSLDWSGGTMAGAGTALTVLPTGSNSTISGAALKTVSGRGITVDGTLTWSGTGNIFYESGALTVQSTGIFDLQSDASLGDPDARFFSAQILNYGTLRKSAGAGTSQFDRALFFNTGTVSAESGTLQFSSFEQHWGVTNLAGGNLVGGGFVFYGGVLSGTGTISGQIINDSGTVAPGGTGAAGTLTLDGSYTQHAGGAIQIEVGGASAGQFDRFNATTATLNGTLNVTLINGFTPLAGTSFTVITHANKTGSFATIKKPGVFTANVTPTALVLDAGTLETVVTTRLDVSDANDGVVSLREAILFANSNPGIDKIVFDIPSEGPHQIYVSSALPVITDPVVIDGFSQPGARANTGGPFFFDDALRLIYLDGHLVTSGSLNGLEISAGSSTVKGLVIQGFHGANIVLEGAGGNVIAGNLIGGRNQPGNNAGANSDHGIFINDSPNNTIGGTAPADRNIIVGNSGIGIAISGATATGNALLGNFIGVDAGGHDGYGNGHDGVSILGGGSNIIGGTTPAARNIISKNRGSGLSITDSTANVVQGNYIGIDSLGLFSAGNWSDGILLRDAAVDNIIGGTAPGAGNVISDNFSGVVIGGKTGPGPSGMATGNIVQGNFIGTTAGGGGTGRLLQGDGIQIVNDASNNIIGGTVAEARNVISGNNGNGVKIAGTGSGNQVLGNFIGTDATGAMPVGNAQNGILLDAPGNIIGGTEAGARNVISGNKQRGVFISGSNNIVQGNFIGTDVTGMIALRNEFDGLTIAAPGSNNLIGGNTPGARNVISGNYISGIRIESLNAQDGFANDNRMQGNYIGVTANGVTPLPNRGENKYGYNEYGWGVVISRQSNNNLIGGTGPGEGNVIAFNDGPGIGVTSGTASGNRITGNSIYFNGGLGINLETGANDLLNYPTITGATRFAIADGFEYTITGTYSGVPNTTVTIDLYVNNVKDPYGFGEGAEPIDSFTLVTDGAGKASFTHLFTTGTTSIFGIPIGDFVTATATLVNGTAGSTSEFSNAFRAILAPRLTISDAAIGEGDGDTRLEFPVRLSWATSIPVSIHFATHDFALGPGANVRSATAGVDYEFQEGDLVFAPGEVEKTISILVHGDLRPEARERFGISLSAVGGASLQDGEAVGAILDDDHHVFFDSQEYGSRVEIRDAHDGDLIRSFNAFAPSFQGGVRIASGDVNGDGFNDVIAGAGSGGGARVRVFDGRNVENGRPVLLYDIAAYGDRYRGGVYVAAGDVNGDGKADIIVAPSAGLSAEVRVFSGDDGSLLSSFFALGRGAGGIRIAAGDVNGDGYADIIAGSGKGSSVRIFDGHNPSVLLDAFRAFPRFYDGGISVAAGDVDGDGLDDVIVGTARDSNLVRIFLSGQEGQAAELAAYGGPLHGVHVGVVDLDSDGIADILTSQGRGGDSKVRIFKGISVLNDAPQVPIKFDAFGPEFSGGVFVG